MRRAMITILAICLLADSASADVYVPPKYRPPSAAAMELAENYRRDGWRLVGGKWFRPALSIDLSELIVARLEGRQLIIEPNISERVEAQLIGLRKPVVDLIGSSWCWRVDVTGRVWNPDRITTTRSLSIAAVSDERPPAETVELTSLVLRPDSTSIGGRGLIDGVFHDVTILLTNSGRFHLMVQCSSPDGKVAPVVNLQGENLFELFDGHAEEARRYVRPLLAMLFNSPTAFGAGPGDVYRIFSEIPSESTIDAQVNALINLMDSPDPAQRDSAHERLEQIGEPAVLSLLRFDRSRLRLEVRQRVAELISHATRFSSEGDTAMLSNPDFLIDCQYSSDPRVRRLAAQRLEAFGIFIDETMTFDQLEEHRGRLGMMN